ncbi:helix-turn-helix domain-containing protein [Actinocorallia sp. API 0066]|uniref:PucR family transcriptional regulator n=1 Tax=Actinocorallia sp. API 0066 TaxID=2896846 RepID=UPI001E5503D8|nr:helix-turn-helix domain-containing protein [Actinocorallia sp. API 0066]MCD0448742.1 helix-turn-helix domain-containing protein [Actinocorallia sp. API 0066]
MAELVMTPLMNRCASTLLDRVDEIGATVYREIMTSNQVYADMDEALREDVREFSARTVTEQLTCMASGVRVSTATARDNACRRARQGVPIDALLHAYRIGYRVVWEALVAEAKTLPDLSLDEFSRASTVMWALADLTSEVVNAVYRETMVAASRDDERQRLLLLDALFEGRVADWALLGGTGQALGLPARGPYLSVVASRDDDPTRLERALLRHGLSSAWRPRPDRLEGIVAVPRAHDPELALEQLDTLVSSQAGLSPSYDALRETAQSLRLAALAKAALPVKARGATTLDADPIAALVAATPDLAARLVTTHLRPLLDHPDSAPLLETLEAWLETGGSTADVAARLYYHRNTVRNRLDRIEHLTGLSLTTPSHTAALYTALKAHHLQTL